MVISLREGNEGLFYLVTAQKNTTDTYQNWNADELRGGQWGYIYNMGNPIGVMDVMYAAGVEGTKVTRYSKNGGNNQQWKYENGYIISRINGMVLQIEDGNTQAGAFIVIGEKNGNDHQKWSHPRLG